MSNRARNKIFRSPETKRWGYTCGRCQVSRVNYRDRDQAYLFFSKHECASKAERTERRAALVAAISAGAVVLTVLLVLAGMYWL